MAKLVYALDLGSSVARREGSSPFRRTPKPKILTVQKKQPGFFYALMKK